MRSCFQPEVPANLFLVNTRRTGVGAIQTDSQGMERLCPCRKSNSARWVGEVTSLTELSRSYKKIKSNLRRKWLIHRLFNDTLSTVCHVASNGRMAMMKRCGRKWPWFILSYYPNIGLEILKEATKNLSQDSHCLVQYLNPGHPKYEEVSQ
jgi:hypothetical protein